jgi:hypothetical protein
MGREQAINQEYEKSLSGRTSFYYVDTGKLERLGIAQHKIQATDNFIRIIPPLDENSFWAKEVFVHRNIGANNATFICLKKMFNKPCPICEYVEELRKKNPEDDIIGELIAYRRYLLFVYDVKSESTETEGLKWLDVPKIIVENIVGLSKDKRTKEVLDVSDPSNGRDVEFVRKGTGLNSKYESFKLVDKNPIPDEWWKDVPTFDSVLLIPTYEQMLKELTGGVTKTVAEGTTGSAKEINTRQGSTRSNKEPKPAVEQQNEEVEDSVSEQKIEQPIQAPARATRTRTDSSQNPQGGTNTSQTVRDKINAIRKQRESSGG